MIGNLALFRCVTKAFLLVKTLLRFQVLMIGLLAVGPLYGERLVAAENSFSLTEKQKDLLKNRSLWKDGFVLRVLQGPVGGEPKTVVLLGESHFKSESSATKAQAIINEFNFYGLEGIDAKEYWGRGEVFGHFLDSFHFVLGQFLSESSVNDVYSAEDEGFEAEKVCRRIQNDLKSGRIGSLEHLLTINRELGSKALPEKELIQIYEVIVNRKTCEDSFAKSVYLEDGYKPTVQDNLAFLMYPVLLSSIVIQKCGAVSCHRWPQFQALKFLHRLPLGVAKVLTAYLLVDLSSRVMFGQKDWLDSFFVFSTAVYYNRNKTMAENIVHGLEENPKRSNMLVLMGMAHLAAVKEQLIKNYGFVEVQADEEI